MRAKTPPTTNIPLLSYAQRKKLVLQCVCAQRGGVVKMYHLSVCVKKKEKFISKKLSRRSELREFREKTSCKSVREVRFIPSLLSPILYTPRKIISDTKYPEKNSGSFRASSSRQLSQHTDSTYYLVRQHRRHTSHLTVDKKNWFLYPIVVTRRQTTVESTEAWSENWRMARMRGVGLFRLLSASTYMSLKECSCSYECGLDMPCLLYTSPSPRD